MTRKMNVGDRFYYTGDMANVDGFGTIAAVREPSEYVSSVAYDVRFDPPDCREIRGVYACMFDPAPGRRFWPLDEWEADRKARIDAMKADRNRLTAAGKL